jgi:hypothetical protein
MTKDLTHSEVDVSDMNVGDMLHSIENERVNMNCKVLLTSSNR